MNSLNSEYDSGWCQGLLELHAHINTQIEKPNSQTKKIIEIIVWMLEIESDTPQIGSETGVSLETMLP